MIVDADLHKSGISPVFIHMNSRDMDETTWWNTWKELVHVTKYGLNKLCNISPWNLPVGSLDSYRGSRNVGMLAIDAIYTKCV